MLIHHQFPFLYVVVLIAVLSAIDPVWKHLAARARRKPRTRRFPRVRTFRVGSDLLK